MNRRSGAPLRDGLGGAMTPIRCSDRYQLSHIIQLVMMDSGDETADSGISSIGILLSCVLGGSPPGVS